MKKQYHIFKDLQTGGFSKHIEINSLAEMLADAYLDFVPLPHFREKYKTGNIENQKQLIIENDYEILPPTSENIQAWKEYTGQEWTLELRSSELGIGLDDSDVSVIFFLEEGEYGFGYIYSDGGNDIPYQVMMFTDRFSREEIVRDDFDESILSGENRRALVGEHESCSDALDELLNFWSQSTVGKLDRSLKFREAIEVGRREKLDFIVF